MFDDTKIKQLIELAVIDDDRKHDYLAALPLMAEEDKVAFGLGLWQLLADKMHVLVVEKAQAMVEEMAQEGGKEYTHDDFAAMEDQVMHDFLKQRSGLQDEDKLSDLRSELKVIQQMVESHDREISELKTKVS